MVHDIPIESYEGPEAFGWCDCNAEHIEQTYWNLPVSQTVAIGPESLEGICRLRKLDKKQIAPPCLSLHDVNWCCEEDAVRLCLVMLHSTDC